MFPDTARSKSAAALSYLRLRALRRFLGTFVDKAPNII